VFHAGTVMLLYRAYLMENGHVWTALDLTCVDDDDAKRQMANLPSGHDVELWQGDRRVAIFRLRKRDSTKAAIRPEHSQS
jgi:hypothetical protein